MAGNIVKWWKHKILGGYKQFSGKRKPSVLNLFSEFPDSCQQIWKRWMLMLSGSAKSSGDGR